MSSLDLSLTCGSIPLPNRYMLGDENLVDAFVAEHVWEHLSLQDAHRATRNCQRHLRPGGRLRLAVPDPAWYYSPSGFSSATSASPTQASNTSIFEKGGGGSGDGDSGVGVPSSGPDSGGKPATREENFDDSNGNVPHRKLFRGKNVQGKREGSIEEEGEPRVEFLLGDDERSNTSGSQTIQADLDLPPWLSLDMLVADARDDHLVQFTPELLANVCWSAGLTPVLVEGGGGEGDSDLRDHVHPSSQSSQETPSKSTSTTASGDTEEEAIVSGFATASGSVDEHVDEDGDDGVVSNGAGDHGRGGDMKAPRHRKPSTPLDSFPTASEHEAEEEERHDHWGRIKRSVKGGDPRGAVSIVMDCIKPVSKNNDEDGLRDALHHPPVHGTAGGIIADNKPSQRPPDNNPNGLNDRHSMQKPEDITLQNCSLPSSSSGPSQQRPSAAGSSLNSTGNFLKPTKTGDETEADRVSFAAVAIGITSGIGYGPGADAGVGRGVVSVGKGTAAVAPAAPALKVNHPDIGDGGITSTTVLKPVLGRLVENNGAGGLDNTFGDGIGVGMGVVMTGCRGLLCDGGGQSSDAAESGEGG